MEAEREKVSVEAALALLPEGETIHTFANPKANLLIGADWDRSEVEEAIRKFEGAWLTGPQAQAMKHGLAVPTESGLYFFQTKVNE